MRKLFLDTVRVGTSAHGTDGKTTSHHNMKLKILHPLTIVHIASLSAADQSC